MTETFGWFTPVMEMVPVIGFSMWSLVSCYRIHKLIVRYRRVKGLDG